MNLSNKVAWFVGSVLSVGDKTEEMIDKGIWFHNYEDTKNNEIHYTRTKEMKVGDLIAIKSTYTKKNNTPFDTNGHYLSVMLIKCIGVITEESKDGTSVKVDWDKDFEQKEWYFFTSRDTIWKVKFDSDESTSYSWAKKGLIEFTFNNRPQDIDGFRNHSYWVDRFGTSDKQFNGDDFCKELGNYDKYNFLEDSFMDEKEYDVLKSLIKRKKNIVLQGSPGVGKTFTAKRLYRRL